MKTIVLLIFWLHYSASKDDKKFVCEDGSMIELEETCDGIKHCPDGSDEVSRLCFNIICPLDAFRCFYGACVPKNVTCDGTNNCADASDECQCGRQIGSCEKNEFKCSSGECIDLNKICNGLNDCDDRSDEEEICERISCPQEAFRCKIGGCIHKEQICNGRNECIDGSDESDIMCKKLNCVGEECDKVHCPPITSSRINAKCEIVSGPLKGIVPCDKPLPEGTIVRYECKPYYIPTNEKHLNNREMICQPDGTWNKEILKCIPDCGNSQSELAPLIVNGWYPQLGQFPWHALLYISKAGKWTFVCGGTLISEQIVLTAAHCTWKMRKDMMRLTLGKVYGDFYKSEDYSQIRNISKIIRHPLYLDFIGNYGSDIAALVLDEPVEFSSVVRPACIDSNLDDTTSDLGMIAGMGVTENNTFSDRLRAVYLPVISDDVCIKQQKRDFKKYVTFTSFCAGWKNGTSVCNGDSGGGLVFPRKGDKLKYTLQGIVSVSPRRRGTSFCDPAYYTVFTKVGMYSEWIIKILQLFHEYSL